MEQAVVFNIQKFSIHDGPGIRTVVFFKGCPLRCLWCSNPESQRMPPQIMRDMKKCTHCGRCAEVCPTGAMSAELSLDDESFQRCVEECPVSALSLAGSRKSVREVFDVVMQDLPFYQKSGGGVTYSGGEPALQTDFIHSLSALLREQGVHIAAETTGYVPERDFLRFADCVDLLLFDLKHTDSLRHREGTGVPNERILSNLRRAAGLGKQIIVRIPVIPGFNDSLRDAEEFAKLLSGIGLTRMHLLPFHQMGEEKYRSLQQEYAMSGVRPLHSEDLKEMADILTAAGLDVQIGG